MRDVDEVSGLIVDAAFHIHMDLGPGLLESVYEAIMEAVLRGRGLTVESQLPVSFEYRGMRFDHSCVVDLLVESQVVVELKAVERLNPVHKRQLLTYLRLLDRRVGLLINFGARDFGDVVHRVVNHYSSSRVKPLPIEHAI